MVGFFWMNKNKSKKLHCKFFSIRICKYYFFKLNRQKSQHESRHYLLISCMSKKFKPYNQELNLIAKTHNLSDFVGCILFVCCCLFLLKSDTPKTQIWARCLNFRGFSALLALTWKLKKPNNNNNQQSFF